MAKQPCDKLVFVRYGGLSSVGQDGYSPAMPTFHAPPARRGIYAFVEETVTLFLLGKEEFDQRRMTWVRDADGRRIPCASPEARALLDGPGGARFFVKRHPDGGFYLARHKKPKRFRYAGSIWHHLPVPRREVLREKGSWALTTAAAHHAAFARALAVRRYNVRLGCTARLLDEFEVFIEKV
jgi:hypothetical protein